MKLLKGDTIEILDTLSNEDVDLVFTSPPYWKGFEYESYFNSYNQYLQWSEVWIEKLKRVLKPNGWFILNIANDSETTVKAFEVLNICLKYWKLHDTIIWNVSNRQPANTVRQLTNQTEFLFVFRHQSAGAVINKEGITEQYPEVFGTKILGNIWRIPFKISKTSLKKVFNGTTGHAGFPPVLCEIVIKLFSNENDKILDCFGGTGIVGKIGHELKRQVILIDKNDIQLEIKE